MKNNSELGECCNINCKILIVEDEDECFELFNDAVEEKKNVIDPQFEEKFKNLKIIHERAENENDAINLLKDQHFDGIIADLRLGNNDHGGNIVLEFIKNNNIRIPIYIITGTPSNIDKTKYPENIFIIERDEANYSNIIDDICEIYNTGITDVFGSGKIIDKYLNDIFYKNLYKQQKEWISHAKKEGHEITKKALLRYTANNLFHLLDQDEFSFFPEEIYIEEHSENKKELLRTGAIIEKNEVENRSYFILLNPACDLTGSIKAKSLVLLEVDTLEADNGYKDCKSPNRKQKRLKKLSTGEELSFHFLPKISTFCGGLINFKKINTIQKEEILGDKAEFKFKKLTVSAHFLRDILSRYSSHCARQGQPGINLYTYSED